MRNNLITIKKFAELCRTTPRTIRFYDQKGLLKPVNVDKWSGYRLYSPYQTLDFFKLRLLQNFHSPLSKIKEKINSKSIDQYLQTNLTSLKKEIDEKHKEYRFLREMKKFLFDTQDGRKFLKPETFGPFILFGTVIKQGQYYQINSYIFELISLAKKFQIPITEKQMIGYIDPVAYKPKDTELKVCLITKLAKITEDLSLPEGYFFEEYKKTEMRVYNYRGPYEYISLIYQKLLENHPFALKPKGLGTDLHIYGPWNKKSPYDHLTKIAFLA